MDNGRGGLRAGGESRCQDVDASAGGKVGVVSKKRGMHRWGSTKTGEQCRLTAESVNDITMYNGAKAVSAEWAVLVFTEVVEL
jgi:hypothetical protein